MLTSLSSFERTILSYCSSVAQWWSNRLLTGRLAVRVRPEEPYGPLVKRFNTAAFHAVIQGFESPTGHHLSGGLAQLGEHLPYKQRVGGSIPSSSTIYLFKMQHYIGEIVKWLNTADCKSAPSGFGGSNPSLPTIPIGV